MKPHSFCLVFFLFIPSAVSSAETLSLETNLVQKKNKLGLSYEMSQFETTEGNLHGSGGRLSFQHSFTENWSTEIFISSAINTQGGVRNSFTGLGGYLLYTVLGTPYSSNKTLSMEGKPLFIDRISGDQAFYVGAGINQYFLNGDQGVYSSSGLSATAIYTFKAFHVHWKVSARYAMLNSADLEVTGLSYDFGFVVPL